jgi:succinoglycan biosynthesis protein ExoL
VYFGPDATHSTVRKRIHAFLAEGVQVVAFTFRRNKIDSDFIPDWPNIPLGVTTDRAYLRRLRALARALATVWRRREAARGADVFFARNFDQQVLAIMAKTLLRSPAKIVYEVPDIQAFFTRRSALGRMFRALERLALKRTDLVVCSSPGFERDYFRTRQKHPGPYFIWENKVLASEVAPTAADGAAPPEPRFEGRWTIGWFGTLRCIRSMRLLSSLAARFPDRLEIYTRGLPTETGVETYRSIVSRYDNFIYEGEYKSPHDLAEMYGRVHFTWGFDFHDASGNSRMLLPNRLYEGGLFGAAPLAHADHETGRYVRDRDIGFVFSEPLEETLAAFFETIDLERYRRARRRLLDMRAEFVDDGADTRALLARIGAL